MTRVMGMHEIELHPGVSEDDFENFFLNEEAKAPSMPDGVSDSWKVIEESEKANI